MQNISSRVVFLSSLLLSWSVQAAVYQEAGGQVVIEAVHFDYRNYEFTDAAIPHHFHIVPDENNVTSATHPWGDTGNNPSDPGGANRSEEHTSELQSHHDLVCRLLLEKKKKKQYKPYPRRRTSCTAPPSHRSKPGAEHMPARHRPGEL